MPRKVQVRASYQNDLGFLARLSQAVERDERLGADEKREIISPLNSAALAIHKAQARLLNNEVTQETNTPKVA